MIHTHTHTTIHLSVYILRANSSLLAISIEPKPYTQFISYARSIISVQSLSYYYFEFPKLFSITEYTTSFCLSLSLYLCNLHTNFEYYQHVPLNNTTQPRVNPQHSEFIYIRLQWGVSLAHLSLAVSLELSANLAQLLIIPLSANANFI